MIDGEIRYFPAIKHPLPPVEQGFKVAEECGEFVAELSRFAAVYDPEAGVAGEHRALLMECWDVVHACETFLSMFDGEPVESAMLAVLEKNDMRGYYRN